MGYSQLPIWLIVGERRAPKTNLIFHHSRPRLKSCSGLVEAFREHIILCDPHSQDNHRRRILLFNFSDPTVLYGHGDEHVAA